MNKDEAIKDMKTAISKAWGLKYEGGLLVKELVDLGYRKVGEDEVVITKREYEQLKKYNRDRKRLRLKWQQAKQALEQERKSCRLIADDEIVESMKTYERARLETAKDILQELNNRYNECGGAVDVAIMLYDWLSEMDKKYGIELED